MSYDASMAINSATAANTAQIGCHPASNSAEELSDMIRKHGAEQVASSGHNQFMAACCDKLKDRIMATDEIPTFLKDDAVNTINQRSQEHLKPVSCECAADVSTSAIGNALAEEGAEAGSESGGAGATAGASGGNQVPNSLDEALMSTAEQQQKLEKESEGKGHSSGGNWLVAMARKLGEIQVKFIDAAMKNLDAMKGLGEGGITGNSANEVDDREKFLLAQSEFQANMQMFNMTANMTSTSLKSIGEGLTAIARKQ